MPARAAALPSLWVRPPPMGAALLLAQQQTPATLETWKVHDYANLAALPVAIALTVAAFVRGQAWRRALAIFMLAYMVIDGAWIVVQPSTVKAWRTLLVHHAVTILLLLHPLTHAAHLKYVAWLCVVEVNTFLLVLRRHIRRSVWIEAAFAASWVAIRAVWFPYVTIHLLFYAGEWPDVFRRVLVCTCCSWLALLQLRWTREAMLATRRRVAAAGAVKSGFL